MSRRLPETAMDAVIDKVLASFDALLYELGSKDPKAVWAAANWSDVAQQHSHALPAAPSPDVQFDPELHELAFDPDEHEIVRADNIED